MTPSRPKAHDGERRQVAAHYDALAPTYEAFARQSLHYGARVKEFLSEGPARRILDVGCGPGQLTRDLPPEVEVVGIDLSPVMIAIARAHRPAGTYRVHDFHDPLPDELGPFDRVLAVGCYEFCRDLAGVTRHLAQVLRPGGRMLLTVAERRPGLALHERPLAVLPPGLPVRFWSFVEVTHAAEAAGLWPVRYHHQPGWTFTAGDERPVILYGVWDLTKPASQPEGSAHE